MTKVSVPTPAPAEAGTPAGSAAPTNYEAAIRELDQLVRSMEAGDMPLDQLLSGYQRGAELLQFCRDRLQAVEEQVKVLDDGALNVWKPQ